jgi:type I restriction enzyme S subunit
MPDSRNMIGCQIFHRANLPEDWSCEPLGNRIKLRYGVGLTEESRVEGKYNVYGSNGIVGTHNEALVDAPGILIGRKGSVGAVHYAEEPFFPIDTVYFVERLRDDSFRYLYYLLDYLNLSRLNAATGVPGLTRKDALSLRGAFPQPDEQIAIANILDAVDEAIKRTRTSLEKAWTVKCGVLQKLLTCGVGKSGEVRNYEDSPEQFKPSRIGLIPAEWEVSRVGVEFNITAGFTLGEHRRPRVNKRKYLRVANVQRDKILLDDVAELEASDKEMEGMLLEENDLLVVEGHANPEEIGRCARVEKEAVGLTFQNHLYRLRAKRLNPRFACLWLNSYWSRSYWRRMCATSSGLNTINQRLLKALLVVVPNLEEQKRIVTFAMAQDTFIQNELTNLQGLEKLKKGLMQDLLTGKVRVKQLVTAESAGD